MGKESIHNLGGMNAALTASKRKLEGEMATLQADMEEMLSEAKDSEEKAKKAMIDAARLADELRSEQEHWAVQEKMRKALEVTVKELQVRYEESESNAAKTGKKAVANLEARYRELGGSLDDESRRYSDAQKNLRKCERRIKELTFQADEDKKNHDTCRTWWKSFSRRSRPTSARSRRLRRSPPSIWPSSARLSRSWRNLKWLQWSRSKAHPCKAPLCKAPLCTAPLCRAPLW